MTTPTLPVVTASGGDVTIMRTLAAGTWGTYTVELPDDLEPPTAPEGARQDGYVSALPVAHRRRIGGFGRRFLRADLTVSAKHGTTDVEENLDLAAQRTESDVFVEFDLTKANLGHLIPEVHFTVGDYLNVLVWGRIITLPVTKIDPIISEGEITDWLVHVGGQIVSDDDQRRADNDATEAKIRQERLERAGVTARAQATASRAEMTAGDALRAATDADGLIQLKVAQARQYSETAAEHSEEALAHTETSRGHSVQSGIYSEQSLAHSRAAQRTSTDAAGHATAASDHATTAAGHSADSLHHSQVASDHSATAAGHSADSLHHSQVASGHSATAAGHSDDAEAASTTAGQHSSTSAAHSSDANLFSLSSQGSAADSAAAKAAAEEARRLAENARASAESERAAAEEARAAAETERMLAETARAAAEEGRSDAESARADAEAARDDAESKRAAAEAARARAMAAMAAASGAMAMAEGSRAAAEAARAQAETLRNAAEQERMSAETERSAAENARRLADLARTDAVDAAVEASEDARSVAADVVTISQMNQVTLGQMADQLASMKQEMVEDSAGRVQKAFVDDAGSTHPDVTLTTVSGSKYARLSNATGRQIFVKAWARSGSDLSLAYGGVYNAATNEYFYITLPNAHVLEVEWVRAASRLVSLNQRSSSGTVPKGVWVTVSRVGTRVGANGGKNADMTATVNWKDATFLPTYGVRIRVGGAVVVSKTETNIGPLIGSAARSQSVVFSTPTLAANALVEVQVYNSLDLAATFSSATFRGSWIEAL